MVKGTTRTGFQFSVPENAMDNMELLDAMAEIASEDSILATGRVLVMLIGKKQRAALYNTLRTEDGRVPIAAAAEALKDIFGAMGERGKNSEPSPE